MDIFLNKPRSQIDLISSFPQTIHTPFPVFY